MGKLGKQAASKKKEKKSKKEKDSLAPTSPRLPLLDDDGNETKAFKLCLVELFKRFDTDGDHLLSEAELRAYSRAANEDGREFTDEELQEVREYFDWKEPASSPVPVPAGAAEPGKIPDASTAADANPAEPLAEAAGAPAESVATAAAAEPAKPAEPAESTELAAPSAPSAPSAPAAAVPAAGATGGGLTLRGWIQLYHTQTTAREDDTWKDLYHLGYGGQLQLRVLRAPASLREYLKRLLALGESGDLKTFVASFVAPDVDVLEQADFVQRLRGEGEGGYAELPDLMDELRCCYNGHVVQKVKVKGDDGPVTFFFRSPAQGCERVDREVSFVRTNGKWHADC